VRYHGSEVAVWPIPCMVMMINAPLRNKTLMVLILEKTTP
jgi:hypothetical protein